MSRRDVGRIVMVLFICTGNIFRSMTAEHALRAALGPNAPTVVRSAGLAPPPHGVIHFVRDYLSAKGLDISQHRPTRLTRAMLDAATLAVAMDVVHRDEIAAEHGRTVPLFSTIAYDREEPMPDVWEVVPDWRDNEDAARAEAERTMDYIIDGTPGFMTRMGALMRR